MKNVNVKEMTSAELRAVVAWMDIAGLRCVMNG